MPWNGSGVFTRQYGTTGWQTDAAAGVKIVANRHDTNDGDLATGINTCLTKDGQNVPTANLPMGGFKHTGVAAAAALTDYLRASDAQNNTPTYLTTVAGTNTITAVAAYSMAALTAGQVFWFIPANTNTAATTLNINGIGAKNVFSRGAACVGNELRASVPACLLYDGTQFHVVDSGYYEALPQLTMVGVQPSTNPVVSGFSGSSTYNSMAGFGNATELVDRAGVNVNWKLTPGSATSQTWALHVSVNISHATTFPASSVLQLIITRFNAANVAQSRIVVAQSDNAAGLSFWAGSGLLVTSIANATDYFSIETLCTSATNYNVFGLHWNAWRIA